MAAQISTAHDADNDDDLYSDNSTSLLPQSLTELSRRPRTHIYIQVIPGDVFPLDVPMPIEFDLLKSVISLAAAIPSELFDLHLEGRPLTSGVQNLPPNSTLRIAFRNPSVFRPFVKIVTLDIQTRTQGDFLVDLERPYDSTVTDLKNQIQGLVNRPIDRIRLYFGNRPIENPYYLWCYGIWNKAPIILEYVEAPTPLSGNVQAYLDFFEAIFSRREEPSSQAITRLRQANGLTQRRDDDDDNLDDESTTETQRGPAVDPAPTNTQAEEKQEMEPPEGSEEKIELDAHDTLERTGPAASASAMDEANPILLAPEHPILLTPEQMLNSIPLGARGQSSSMITQSVKQNLDISTIDRWAHAICNAESRSVNTVSSIVGLDPIAGAERLSFKIICKPLYGTVDAEIMLAATTQGRETVKFVKFTLGKQMLLDQFRSRFGPGKATVRGVYRFEVCPRGAERACAILAETGFPRDYVARVTLYITRLSLPVSAPPAVLRLGIEPAPSKQDDMSGRTGLVPVSEDDMSGKNELVPRSYDAVDAPTTTGLAMQKKTVREDDIPGRNGLVPRSDAPTATGSAIQKKKSKFLGFARSLGRFKNKLSKK